MQAFPKDPLRNKIFKSLRDKIVFMEYPPGMSLSDKELCRIFKVSRTPLREAIRRLEEMRLVTVVPRFGTYVSPIDINEIRCAFEVKTKLEGLAGALAASRITHDRLEQLRVLVGKADVLLSEGSHRNLIEIDNSFHEIICQATQNPILQEMHENLQSRCARLWNSALSDITSVEEIVSQLREVYLSLEKRDSEKAAYLLESHVKYFVDLIKSQLL